MVKGERMLMRKWAAGVALATVCALVLAIWPAERQMAAAGDDVRVAIYLNLPGKITSTVPVVTLSSSQALSIGVRHPAGAESWTSAEAGKAARFSLDDYKVKLGETTDFQTALGWLNAAQKNSDAVLLTSLSKSGQTVYQVTEGSYDSEAAAKAALDKWQSNSALVKLLGQNKPALVGPMHLEAGPYTTLAEAKKMQAAAGSTGVDAYIALKQPAGSGKLQYYIHVGAAVSQAALAQVKTLADKAGLGSLTDASAAVPYLLLRDDYTLSKKAGDSVPLYLSGAAAKVWVSAAGGGTVKLKERSERVYRGSLELSAFNGKLAVINELPMDHYLYSVVGAEMSPSWPMEALKAQAVAARSYARYQGMGFQIAHVVDSVLSQVYEGTGREAEATLRAVDATSGEVVMYKGAVIEAVFSSSSGGMTAEGKEVWGNAVPYLQSVKSPDETSEQGLLSWYRVVLPSGKSGYIREDLLEDTGAKTAAGSVIMRVKQDGTNVRPIPLVQTSVEPVAKVDSGTKVIGLEKVIQSNENRWIRGPFTSAQLLESLKTRVQAPVSGPVHSLQAAERGASGRVLTLAINGKKVELRYPDLLRSALGGLPSTKFEVEETARVAMAGSNESRERNGSETMHVLGADGQAKTLSGDNFYVLNGAGTIRIATKDAQYRFIGQGYGHGLGMSQYGAKGLAEQGYDYKSILQYYYKDTTIGKE